MESLLWSIVLLCSVVNNFGIHILFSFPPYLFSISAPSAGQIIISAHLARPLSARHAIFGIVPFCPTASQWHQLSPLPFQHPLLSAPQSWSIYPPSADLFHKQPQLKEGGDVEMSARQSSNQSASLPAKHCSLPSVSCKAHLLEAALDAISNSIPSLNLPESF